jgi:hypothetical protein
LDPVLHHARPVPRRRREDPGVRCRGRPRGARRPLRALFYYCLDPDPAVARALADPFIPSGGVDDATLARCAAFGPPALVRERLEAYVAGGGSKFILRPMCPPDRMLDQLDQLAADVVPTFHRRGG